MERIIEVCGLEKWYKGQKALDLVNFGVERGALFSLLGENGAGKSTILSILGTLLKPDGGTVKIRGDIVGKDDQRIRAHIGVVFQESLMDKTLSVRENLYARAHFYPNGKEALTKHLPLFIKAARMEGIMDRRYGTLSGGERRKADIARALIHMPDLLLLDEPTTGLDPHVRSDIWEILRNYQKKYGITIVCTTHYMGEVADSDYIVLMKEGKIRAEGTPKNLRLACGMDILSLKTASIKQTERKLRKRNISCTSREESLLVPVKSANEAVSILEECRQELRAFEIHKASMEDVFLQVLGGRA
ncbi:MAG: ABC transporter ATP-binding protein [Lachnospiraceae bacterium]|nr:ABC transporter ATP-binding protein [Lachnospiraceae bacterium]